MTTDTDDLVKRLRDLRLEALEMLQREQRDRIEQLERENARLRETLTDLLAQVNAFIEKHGEAD